MESVNVNEIFITHGGDCADVQTCSLRVGQAEQYVPVNHKANLALCLAHQSKLLPLQSVNDVLHISSTCLATSGYETNKRAVQGGNGPFPSG